MGNLFSSLLGNLQVLGQAAKTNLGNAASAVGNFLTKPLPTGNLNQTASVSNIIPATVKPNQSTPFGPAGPVNGQGSFVNVPGVGGVNVGGSQVSQNASVLPNASTFFGPANVSGGLTTFNQSQIRPIVPAAPTGLGASQPPQPTFASQQLGGIQNIQSAASSTPFVQKQTSFVGSPSAGSGSPAAGIASGSPGGGQRVGAMVAGQGASSGLSSGTTGKPEEEELQKQAKQFIPLASPFAIPSDFTATTTPQGGTAYMSPEGFKYIPTANGLQLAPQTLEGNLPSVVVDSNTGRTLTQATGAQQVNFQPTTGFTAGPTKNVEDIALLEATQETLKKITTDPTFKYTKEEFHNSVTAKIQEVTNRLKAERPVPENPAVDTAEQQQYLNSLGTQAAAAKQAMDQARMSLGLPALEKQRIDLMTKMEASMAAFDEIIKSINENPEFPKALAERRISAFTKESEKAVKLLKGQLDIVSQQIKDGNDQLNLMFNIQKDQAAEEERAKDDARQLLQLAISSKGLGSMTDEQLNELTASGFSLDSLKQVRQAVRTSAGDVTNVQYLKDDAGNVNVVGLDSNNRPVRLGTLEGVASAGGGRFTPTQLNQGQQTAGISQQDFMSLPDDVKNEFISGSVDSKKKNIDQALTEGYSASEIEKTISEDSTLIPEVKDSLTRYLKGKASAQPASGGFLGNATKSIFDFFTR